MRGPLSARGFTLIEMMITVVILVILITVGVPSFRDFILVQRVKNASFEVFAALVLTRSEAVSRNNTVTITPTGGNWANGWQITTVDPTTLATVNISNQSAYSNITITGPATIAYAGTGRSAAASISLVATGVSAARCITIDLSGRPVTKTGTCL